MTNCNFENCTNFLIVKFVLILSAIPHSSFVIPPSLYITVQIVIYSTIPPRLKMHAVGRIQKCDDHKHKYWSLIFGLE